MTSANPVANCSAYRNGKKLDDIRIDDIDGVLKEEGTFVWVGLVEPSAELMIRVQREFDLHELAVEDAQGAHQRPKLEEYGDTVFLVLQTAELVDGAVHIGETHLFMGKRFIVSVRHGSSVGYAKVREHCESRPDRLAKGPGYVLYSIIDFVVDRYQPVIDDLERRFNTYEERLFAPGPGFSSLKDYYQLKNELLKLRAAAVPLLDIGNQLLRFHSDLIPKESRIYYRDIIDHVRRVTETGDRMQEMINAAMQVDLAQVTIRQNEVVKRLAGWGAILAVPTMIFSLYGMNFKHMPELEWRWGYPAVLLAIGVGCVALYRRLRRIGWL